MVNENVSNSQPDNVKSLADLMREKRENTEKELIGKQITMSESVEERRNRLKA